jgi:hypothetical protein
VICSCLRPPPLPLRGSLEFQHGEVAKRNGRKHKTPEVAWKEKEKGSGGVADFRGLCFSFFFGWRFMIMITGLLLCTYAYAGGENKNKAKCKSQIANKNKNKANVDRKTTQRMEDPATSIASVRYVAAR